MLEDGSRIRDIFVRRNRLVIHREDPRVESILINNRRRQTNVVGAQGMGPTKTHASIANVTDIG